MLFSPHKPRVKSLEEASKLYLTAEKAVMMETLERVKKWALKYYGPDWLNLIKAEMDMWAVADWVDDNDAFYLFKCLSKGKYCAFRHALGDHYGIDVVAKNLLEARNSWAHFSMGLTMDNIEADIQKTLDFAELVHLDSAPSIREALEILQGLSTAQENVTNHPVSAPKSEEEEAEELEPRPRIGEPWNAELPATRCDLNQKINDVRVVETGESLKSRWPSVELANQNLSRWFKLRPTPTTLYADLRDGATVGFIQGLPYFFGFIGDDPEIGPQQFQGFMDSDVLEYLDGALRKVGTESDLLEKSQFRDQVIGQLEQSKCPDGATLRLTNYGHIVLTDEMGSRRVASIPPEVYLALN